jgi:hypothetical protein
MLGGSGGEPLECVLPAPGLGSAADPDRRPNRAPARGMVAVISLAGHHALRAQPWDISGYVYLTGQLTGRVSQCDGIAMH